MGLISDFSQTVNLLGNPQEPLTASLIYSLSHLSLDELAMLAKAWPAYPVERRRQLIRRLGETSEANFEVNFEAVHELALEDADGEVRTAAIEGMWENESVSHMRRLTTMASSDAVASVRAAAASALGRFVLLGELGKFPTEAAALAQDTVLAILRRHDEHPDVRRRSLESISNCGREGVSELIEEAYYGSSIEMRASAIFAMGRSCDPRWGAIILEELEGDEPTLLYEAARAAGELEIREAVYRLGDLLEYDDREVQEMAVWALGEVGGDEACDLLEAAAENAPDDGFAEAVEEALEAARLAGEDIRFDLFNFEGW
jgi:HEAT repeat protein